MGFWARDHADLHDFWLPPVRLSGTVSPPARFPCHLCEFVGGSTDELYDHQSTGHVSQAPMLYYRGIPCGKTVLTISSATSPGDWRPIAVRSATLNERAISVDDLPEALSSHRQSYLEIELHGLHTDTSARVRFDIATEADLAGVESCVARIVETQRLDIRAIAEFIQCAERHVSAAGYTDGLASYMYGVLARDRSPESGLAHEEYRQKFNEAANRLRPLARPLAQSITGLVAFHFNQFDQLPRTTEGTRLGRVAGRILKCLSGGRLPADALDHPGTQEEVLDAAFSDIETEQVIRAWGRGSSASPAPVEELLVRADRLDLLKLRVLAGERWLAAGELAKAAHHAHELRNTPSTTKWASSILALTDRNGDPTGLR